jgi:phosphatidylserine/phosphatidylglycerophosphate/cardiolipin synthase-like enzyme
MIAFHLSPLTYYLSPLTHIYQLTMGPSAIYNTLSRLRRPIMKKFHPFLILILLSSLVLPCITASGAEVTLDNTTAKVFFSPNGGCVKGIVKEIEMGTREILVQAYSFSSTPIRNALINAQKRGANVEIIFDKEDQKDQNYRAVKSFSKNGIAVYLDGSHTIAHNKAIIIDRETVITGSFNFTNAAETKNAENVLVVKSKALAGLYAENWYAHLKHSSKF